MWFERRRDWWRVVLSSVKVLIFLRLLPRRLLRLVFVCWVQMSGKIVRLNRSLYGLKQASRSWHNHLITHMKSLGFEQSLADACVLRLIESGSVSIVTVVHVDDIFAVGLKARCDQFCEDLNRLVPLKTPRRGLMLVLGGIPHFQLV